MVDPFGRVLARLDLGTEGVLDAPLPAPLPPTPFARFGNALPLFLVSLLALLINFPAWRVWRARGHIPQ